MDGLGVSYVWARTAANSQYSDNQSVDFEALVQSIERSPFVAPADAADALRRVLGGVITGEGPTTLGRAHFSRTLDSIDAGLCARILIASGGDRSIPVSREKAELLIDIDAAGSGTHRWRPVRHLVRQSHYPLRPGRRWPAGAAATRGAIAGYPRFRPGRRQLPPTLIMKSCNGSSAKPKPVNGRTAR